MNVDFLSPVEDKLLAHNLMLPEQVIGRNLQIHTQQQGFPDLKNVSVAFLTIGSRLPSKESIHVRFRRQFYALFSGNWDFTCADLGVIKPGERDEDTLFAIQTLVYDMYQRNILTIVIGGEQENTLGMFRAICVHPTDCSKHSPGILVCATQYNC